VAQDIDEIDFDDDDAQRDFDSHGLLVDLAAGYRLPKRRGVIALEVTNLLDQHLSFQDESFRTGALDPTRDEVNPRFVPSRAFLATLTLNF
jgi:outer membrane receptor protein involved in Fe transport